MPQNSAKKLMEQRSVEVMESVSAKQDSYVETMEQTESRAAAFNDSDTIPLV